MNGDLISREALEKTILNVVFSNTIDTKYNGTTYISLGFVLNTIDNAPSVEPEKALIANVTFDEDKLKEIVQTEVIDKIKSGELVLEAEIPQGAWIRLDLAKKVIAKFKGYLDEDMIERIQIALEKENEAQMQKGGTE